MRSILAGLVLVLLPGLASAECLCTCIRGKATAVCRPQALVEPICQQVCVDKLEQSLGQIGGSGGGGGGALGGGIGLGSTLGVGNDIGTGVGIDAGSGVGTSVGDTGAVGSVDPATGVINTYERSPQTLQTGR